MLHALSVQAEVVGPSRWHSWKSRANSQEIKFYPPILIAVKCRQIQNISVISGPKIISWDRPHRPLHWPFWRTSEWPWNNGARIRSWTSPGMQLRCDFRTHCLPEARATFVLIQIAEVERNESGIVVRSFHPIRRGSRK